MPVYNLEVAEDHSYVAAGFVVHNCGACAAMDGTYHPLEEELDDHICGRCSAIPITRPWSEILSDAGVPPEQLPPELAAADALAAAGRPVGQTAADWLARQSVETQNLVLGPAKAEAWRQGAFQLSDLVGVRHDPVWGSSIQELSLRQMGLDAQSWLTAAREGGSGSMLADEEALARANAQTFQAHAEAQIQSEWEQARAEAIAAADTAAAQGDAQALTSWEQQRAEAIADTLAQSRGADIPTASEWSQAREQAIAEAQAQAQAAGLTPSEWERQRAEAIAQAEGQGQGFALKEPPTTATYTRDALADKSMAELRQIAKEVGASPARSKAETIDRILEAQPATGARVEASAEKPAPETPILSAADARRQRIADVMTRQRGDLVYSDKVQAALAHMSENEALAISRGTIARDRYEHYIGRPVSDAEFAEYKAAAESTARASVTSDESSPSVEPTLLSDAERAAVQEAVAAGDLPKSYAKYTTVEQLTKTKKGAQWYAATRAPEGKAEAKTAETAATTPPGPSRQAIADSKRLPDLRQQEADLQAQLDDLRAQITRGTSLDASREEATRATYVLGPQASDLWKRLNRLQGRIARAEAVAGVQVSEPTPLPNELAILGDENTAPSTSGATAGVDAVAGADGLHAQLEPLPVDATVADAQDWLQAQLPNLKQADLMNLDAQTARLVANAMGNILPALPEVANTLLRIEATNLYTDALALVPRDGLSLMLNPEKWADLADLAERTPTYAAQGWWVSLTPEQILGHEVGHLAQIIYGISNETWIAAMDRVAALGYDPLVSQYAGDKIEESFAETFALLIYGQPTTAQAPIAQELATLLQAQGLDYRRLRAAAGSAPLDLEALS